MSHPLRLVCVALIAVASLSSCASTTAGQPSAAGAAAATAATTTTAAAVDAKTWTNKVCGTLLTFVKASKKQPSFDGLAPSAIVAKLGTYLGDLEGAIDTTTTELKAAGPAPVAAGDTFITTLTDALAVMRTSVDKTRVNIKKVNPRDPDALEKALEPMTAVEAQLAPLDHLEAGPELDAAAAASPNCRELEHTS